MIVKLLVFVPLNILVSVILFRTLFLYKSEDPPKSCLETPNHERIKLNQGMVDRFRAILKTKTISYAPHKYEGDELVKLINLIANSYPEIHRSPFIKRECVSNLTLLYTIEGSNKNLRPYLLTTHLDVVPAVDEKWTAARPFGADLRPDEHIYARGTIDAKHLLVSMLEALENMIKNGFRPTRSFYLVFGHDEEVGGIEGAQSVSKLLPQRLNQSNWDHLEFILDEGNIISKTRVPGINNDIALVGVVEKGSVNIKLSTVGAVGHGSMPPEETAIAKLSSAVTKFHSHLLPSFFGRGAEREMIDIFAAHASWPYKLVYANFWLFRPILEYVFSSDPSMNSLIRTSTAVTMISGGTKENVLPDSAQAIINHRIHPLQSVDEIYEFDRKIVDDPTIDIQIYGHNTNPSPVAPYCAECFGWQLIKQSVLQVYPNSIVVPSVFLAASDSRWYVNLTDSIYKFSAISIPIEEMHRFHGHDERISLENFENLINFFNHLMENSDISEQNFMLKHLQQQHNEL